MTHEELLAKINEPLNKVFANHQEVKNLQAALRAIVELHKPSGMDDYFCSYCPANYPCLTIQAIEEELK